MTNDPSRSGHSDATAAGAPTDESGKPKARPSLKVTIRIAGVLLAIVAGMALFAGLLGADPVLYGGGTGLLVGLGFLSHYFPSVGRAINRGLRAYFTFTFVLMVFLAPVFGARVFFAWVLDTLPMVMQIVVFVLSGLILAWLLSKIATQAQRERFWEQLHSEADGSALPGYLLAIGYVVFVSILGWLFFSSVTFLLWENAGLEFSAAEGGAAEVTSGSILDFYLWQFLDAIPLLKINGTLDFTQPLEYGGFWAGSILLVFKLAVIIPAISGFISYLGRRRAHEPKYGDMYA